MRKTKKQPKTGACMTIKGEVFRQDVIIGLGVTPERLIEYGERKFVDPFTDLDKKTITRNPQLGKVVRLESHAYILWCRDFPSSFESFSTLSHEIFHVVDMILRNSGITLSDDSDEIYAYMIDYYTRVIYKKLKLV